MAHRWRATALIALAAAAAALALPRLPHGDLFVLKSDDLQFRLFARPEKASPRIVLVEVDQASLDHFEGDNIPFPWPRSLYNPLVEFCAAAGARAVLFDILFTNTSPYGEAVDEEFAGALRGAGNAVLAAAFTRGGAPAPPLEERLSLPFTGVSPAGLVREGASLPLPALRGAARGIGSVSHPPDADGVYRRMRPFVLHGGRAVPSLAAAGLLEQGETPAFADGEVIFGGRRVPIDREGFMWINYRGPRGTWDAYPAAAVISAGLDGGAGTPPVPPERFRDAYVIVGYTAPGLFDLKPTPFSAVSPGMEITAAALDTLLGGDFIAPAPAAANAALALAAAGAVAAGVALLTPAAAAVSVAAVFVLLGAALRAAFAGGLLLNAVSLAAAPLAALLAAAIYRYLTEGKRRRFVTGVLGRYVSPRVVREILEDPSRLALGGEKRKITILFSDLAGFTGISERLAPHDLVAVLNDYTTLMAETVIRFDGTVDKYIGDAVMAFWGAPVDQPDQAARALLAALECRRRMEEFAARVAAAGGPKLGMRIGVNTGECIVGNMGSRQRFDYTAIGDAVNQASRLEGLNKAYGTGILAAEPTWREAEGAVFGRLVDFMRVKGKAEPVRAYEVMAAAGEETDLMRVLRDEYEKAFDAYLGRRWEEAIALTDAILARAGDGPARTLGARARAHRDDPPPPDWDGAFTHTSK